MALIVEMSYGMTNQIIKKITVINIYHPHIWRIEVRMDG